MVRPEDNEALIKQLPEIYTKKHAEAGDPTVNDDVDLGYHVGDTWVNTADGGGFLCTDNTADAAVWREFTFV